MYECMVQDLSSLSRSKILKVANELGYFKKINNVSDLKPEIALLYRVNGNEQLQEEYFSFLRDAVNTVGKEKGAKEEEQSLKTEEEKKAEMASKKEATQVDGQKEQERKVLRHIFPWMK